MQLVQTEAEKIIKLDPKDFQVFKSILSHCHGIQTRLLSCPFHSPEGRLYGSPDMQFSPGQDFWVGQFSAPVTTNDGWETQAEVTVYLK